jgi:hypothetical protein
MKKAIFSPLCSAFVIPGLGQLINQDLKKGMLILLGVLFLVIAGIIRLYQMFNVVVKELPINELYPEKVIAELGQQNCVFLGLVLTAFAGLWVYSVVNACLKGKELDELEEKNLLP